MNLFYSDFIGRTRTSRVDAISKVVFMELAVLSPNANSRLKQEWKVLDGVLLILLGSSTFSTSIIANKGVAEHPIQ